jgi:hypothetical protein
MHSEGHVSVASSQLATENVTLALARWLTVTPVAVLSTMAITHAKTRARNSICRLEPYRNKGRSRNSLVDTVTRLRT